ncbi:MAG: alcohol dehydrogenase catalytic domain-containing protein, partial [Opitutaceae bacterium]
MQALVLTAPSRLEVRAMPEPVPAEDEVLLRIHACGICGSDIHGWDGSTGRRRPPLIMGHEAAGEVLAAGARATGWRPGDRVTFDSTISCGACASCTAGQVNLCANRRVVGVAPAEYRQHGAFAERLALPARVLYRLPDTLPYPEAAMVEPVSIAVHAVTRWREALRGRGEEPAGQPVVVVGAGMIGLLVIQALRWAGAGEILAIDLADNRLELARRLGATQVINSGRTDAAAAVAAAAGGAGGAGALGGGGA